MAAFNRVYGRRGRKVGRGPTAAKGGWPLLSYPESAAAMEAAVGGGLWAGGAGWLCEEASGTLLPVYGSGNLAVTGAPNYRVQGAVGDFAVQTTVDGTTQNWSGGDIFDCLAADDILLAGVTRVDSAPAATRYLHGKVGTDFYGMRINSGVAGVLNFVGNDSVGVTSWTASATATLHVNNWWAWLAAWERGAGANGQARIVTTKNKGVLVNATGPIGTLNNAAGFGIGRPGSTTAAFSTSAFYVSIGPGVAAGAMTNLGAWLDNFQAALGLP